MSTRQTSALIVGLLLLVVVVAAFYSRALTRLTWQDHTPLHRAALTGRTQVAADLVAKGADVNAMDESTFGWTPLHEAAFAGHVGIAELLLINSDFFFNFELI